MAVFVVSGIVLITLSLLILSTTGPSQKWRSANELAGELIRVAKSRNGQIELTKYADTVCLVAESLSPRAFAVTRFPGYTIRSDEKSDYSEGVWFILLIFEKDMIVEVYSVDQRVLSWEVSEDTRAKDARLCPRSIIICLQGEVPRVEATSNGEAP